MPKKNTISKKFGDTIKGFETEYFFLRDLYIKNKWSLSAIHAVMMRFIEGWKIDGLDKTEHTPMSLDLENKIILLRKLNHNRQSEVYFITQYGENLGKIKFKSLQAKQAYTNSREYKGMSEDEFKEYNKSRACTLENFIIRYGLEAGSKKFSVYRDRQSYTKTLPYFKEKYGEDGECIYRNINKTKSHTLESYMLRLNDPDKAFIEYEKYWTCKVRSFYSRSGARLFRKLEEDLCIDHCYYAPKTKEFGLYCAKTRSYMFYDFVIPCKKICIEYNGDVFHANPKLYASEDHPNPYNKSITAKEIWEHDRIKINNIMDRGYRVIVV